MKHSILLFALACLALAGVAVAQDTTWIDATTPGALETTINGDTATGGVRANPNRIYVLHKDQVYVQNAGIVFKGGSTLTIVGEKGGAYPVVQMRPVHGVDPGDLLNGIANMVEGSLHLDHVYWLGKTTDGTQFNHLFGMTTVNNLSQSCVVNDCVTEFIGLDTFNGDGWNHGAKFKFTNCYFRALFNGEQWWAGRVMYCKKPIDTLWVENCTVTGGGLIFLQQEAGTRLAYFNHNTIINCTKTWLENKYYQNLFVTNNLFINHNWVGEDTVNVTSGGSNPDTSRTGTINLDSITIRQQVFTDWIKPNSTIDNTKVGLDKLRILVSNNISWTDTLLNSYYTNRNHKWNSIAPYPLSYLIWAGRGSGPWPVTNIPGVWNNTRTAVFFATYRNMVQEHNIFTRVDTKTPAIKDASIVDLMGAWNQSQWDDPAYPTTTTDLLMSAYVPGDKDAKTLPGFTNGVKSEDGQTARVAKVSDFVENYAQSGLKTLSTIDGLPIGALQWDDQTLNSAEAYSQVLAYYVSLLPDLAVPETRGAVQSFTLSQNYPNPFNPTTMICYGLPHRSHVTLTVYNTLGQRVAILVNGDIDAGYHEVKFDGSRLASGVYFYRIQAGSFVETKKLCTVR